MQAQSNTPEFNYHLLRNALNSFHKNIQELSTDEYQQVYRKAARTYKLESLVVAAPEAVGVVIAERHLDQALREVAERYASHTEFVQDLHANQLDETGLRYAIYRELLFVTALAATRRSTASNSNSR